MNHVMLVDFDGSPVRAHTDGGLICLTDLILAGNKWRSNNGLPAKQLRQIVDSVGYKDFLKAYLEISGKNEDDVVKIVGRKGRQYTMADIYMSIYVAEQMSPHFHVKVIQEFVDGKILQFRQLGATEFGSLNKAIDKYLPERDGKDNKGIYITVAKRLREKILGSDATIDSWGTADSHDTQRRYEYEKSLIQFLSLGMVKNFEHLKELIGKL